MLKFLDNTLLDEVLLAVAAVSAVILGLWAAGHALLNKRDPRSALVWVSLSLSLPLVGACAYWLLGINRITRRALRWQKRGKRLSWHELLSRQHDSSALLPDLFAHLQELVVLGDRVVRNRLRDGNQFAILENGEQAYPAMLAAINQARETINLCSYIFDGDGVGADFVKALSDAAQRGVMVRVIVDAVGERYSAITARSALSRSGVDIRLYLPLSQGPFINLRNHRKLLVVDGVCAFTGGMNIRSRHCVSRTSTAEATRDLHFRVQGPVVSDLQRIFIEDWFFASGQVLSDSRLFPDIEPCGHALARAIGDGPDRDFRKLEWIIMGALSSARHTVLIMTPYFVPDRAMITALTTTALRGVEVVLLLPALNNLPFVAWASRASYWELLKNGVKIFEQQASFVHTKLMLVDNLWAMIGSANFDTRSLRLNFELNVSVFDREFATTLRKHIDDARANSRVITLSEIDGRSLPVRLRDGFARLFTPYL